MKSTTLPNNRQVYCFDKNEAYILYLHVSEYLKHGITVKEGDLIFDVGANIGLFRDLPRNKVPANLRNKSIHD